VATQESSGVPGVDAALGGGLLTGDNVVWIGGDDALHAVLQTGFFGAVRTGAPSCFVATRTAPVTARATVGSAAEVLDARPGKRLAEPVPLERAILERAAPGGRVAIEHLDDLVRRLGPERALALFSRVCPQLFDIGATCYWRAGQGSASIRTQVRSITQCVLDVSAGRLRVEKAEGRHGVQGRIHRLVVSEGRVEVAEERAIGRLAEGLRRLRAERGLSQSDLARVAGVSASAISQAEAGRRGLALETVMNLAEGVGVRLDDLLGAPAQAGHVIARRDRGPTRGGVTPLLDDPDGGLRAYLVQLDPGERSEPPAVHKGSELIVVAAGLIQVDLGDETPVLRAGDAVRATTAEVRRWRNLLASPARFFWILRDPLPRRA
jgi:transcriptional regulator with XRE-family HTH domain